MKHLLESYILILMGMFMIYMVRGRFSNTKVLDSLALHLNHTTVIGIMVVMLILVRIAINKREVLQKNSLKRITYSDKSIQIIILSIVLVVAAIVLYELHIVCLSDSFGTGRGFIWNRLMKTYHETSIRNKLFGFGPETIGVIFNTQYAEETKQFIKLNVNAAHNELLQYLMTVGFVGLCSYVIMMISVCWRGLHNKYGYALIIMVIGYVAHSFIGIAQPNTTPILFIAIAMLESLNRMFSTEVVNS